MKLPGPIWRPLLKHTPRALPFARKLMEAAAAQGATLEELRNAAKIAVAAYGEPWEVQLVDRVAGGTVRAAELPERELDGDWSL